MVKEGRAIIKVPFADKISKKMDVFYNPVMKINRDISILLLNSIDNKNMQIALPLAGSGVRGIRFLKELKTGKVKSISFNDYSINAVNSIKSNLKLNKINYFSIKNDYNENKRIQIYNEDANLFLLNSRGFDYIDIDPFGSSNFFLDSAIKRISRNGILAVTNTDTAALTGTYPKACVRKYWALPKRDYLMHETGLRILIRKIQLLGMQYEKALFPVFSFFKNHYFRVFFRCVKGKSLCDDIAMRHGMFNGSGPLWIGSLWDSKLTSKMHSTIIKKTLNKTSIEKDKMGNNNKKIDNKYLINNNQNYNELSKFLKIIKDESKVNIVGFYDMHNIAEKMKFGSLAKKEDIIKKIKKKGFKVAATHFSGTGIRSNIPYGKLIWLLKE